MQIDLERFLGKCSCGQTHSVSAFGIYIEPKASRYLSELLLPYKCPTFICDSKTKKATEETLSEYFEKNKVIELSGDAIYADNINTSYISERIEDEADILIAVGSGTIHDLTKYIAFKRKLPFISMPTAASVDGLLSAFAAITWNGVKKTFPARAPLFVLADTDIFSNAPYKLTASGISDLMGKYEALADWKISHTIAGEYFCPKIYNMEIKAIGEVESVLDKIKTGDEESIEKLMYALILSDLATKMIGNSKPA